VHPIYITREEDEEEEEEERGAGGDISAAADGGLVDQSSLRANLDSMAGLATSTIAKTFT